jgi:lipid-binding SYLF domain-containing protein
MNWFFTVLLVAGIASAQEVNPDRRLMHATDALRAFLSAESNVPHELAGTAQCVVVVPRLMKGAFLVREKYGRGFASCRRASGGWSSPAAVTVEGPQLGASDSDLVLLVMKPITADGFTVGGEAEVTSFFRTKDLFAALSLAGATLRSDPAENKKLYGHETGQDEIFSGKAVLPRGARTFVALLTKHARKPK